MGGEDREETLVGIKLINFIGKYLFSILRLNLLECGVYFGCIRLSS